MEPLTEQELLKEIVAVVEAMEALDEIIYELLTNQEDAVSREEHERLERQIEILSLQVAKNAEQKFRTLQDMSIRPTFRASAYQS